MVKVEMVALGGTIDPEGKKPPIGGSSTAFICGDSLLVFDSGSYFLTRRDLRKKTRSILPQMEFKKIGPYHFPILPPPLLDLTEEVIPPLNKETLPAFELLEGHNFKNIFVIATHGHGDHTGSLPYFYQFLKRRFRGSKIKVFMTEPTLRISLWSWRDYISRMRKTQSALLFTEEQVKQLAEATNFIGLYDELGLGPFKLKFFGAGHILGAVSTRILVQDGRSQIRFFHTGDISFANQHTVQGAPMFDTQILGPIDFLITESTYINRGFPPRKKLENELVDSAIRHLHRGGRVLLPCLSIGRAQEILKLLHKYGVIGNGLWPVFVDGAARHLTEIYVAHGALNGHFLDFNIESNEEREVIAQRTDPLVMIASSGMLIGGPSVFYAKRWADDPKTLIALTCYQRPGSPGYRLLKLAKGRRIVIDGKELTLRADVRHHHLSAHASGTEVETLMWYLRPKKTFLVHGAKAGMLKAQEKWGELVVPMVVGQRYQF